VAAARFALHLRSARSGEELTSRFRGSVRFAPPLKVREFLFRNNFGTLSEAWRVDSERPFDHSVLPKP
jgi:hypothetical protein